MMSVYDSVMGAYQQAGALVKQGQDQRKANTLAPLTAQYAAGGQPDYQAWGAAGGDPMALQKNSDQRLAQDISAFLTNPDPVVYQQTLAARLKTRFPQVGSSADNFDPSHAEGLAKLVPILAQNGGGQQGQSADVQTLQYLQHNPQALDTFKQMKSAGHAPPGWSMANIPDPNDPNNVVPVWKNNQGQVYSLDGTPLYGGPGQSAPNYATPPSGKTTASDGSPVIIDPAMSANDRAAILANPQAFSVPNAPVQGPPIVGSANSTPPPGLTLPARSAPAIPGNIPGSRPRFKPAAQSGSDDDANTIADAIANGHQPPVLTGLYGHSAAVRARLEKMGFNLTKANQDWIATQRLYQTLNGTQQTRLREAVGMVKESIPLLRGLISEWDAGGFPILNRARMELAKQGVMGQKAQSIATRLDQQIADMTGEVATVIMGGNSPTDHGLELAGKQFQGNWTKQTALEALVQTEKNIQYRENSINNLGTSGILDSQFNQQNPTESLGRPPDVSPGLTPNASDAARSSAPPGVTVWTKDANGKYVKVQP